MPSKATKARMLAELRRLIEDHGWAIESIGAQCSVPGCCSVRRPQGTAVDFGYTVGLSRFQGHPELIVTGVPQRETAGPLNLIGERVRAGAGFAAGDLLGGLYRCDCRVILVEIDPRESVRHLLAANQLYRNPGASPVRALQLVWPDQGGRFPWEQGYSLPASAQPVLGPTPTSV